MYKHTPRDTVDVKRRRCPKIVRMLTSVFHHFKLSSNSVYLFKRCGERASNALVSISGTQKSYYMRPAHVLRIKLNVYPETPYETPSSHLVDEL